jgi:hypothetical protein
MVIHDLDIVGILVNPFKAHAPLVVDPDAVLSSPLTTQGLQAIGGRLKAFNGT